MKKLGFILLLSASVLAGCTRSNHAKKNIVSEHFKNMDFKGGTPKFVALLQLKNPALLSQMQKDENGKMVVDESLKQAIIAEQADLKAQLANISPDITILYSYDMVLNALAIVAPQSKADEISELDVEDIQPEESFSLPAGEDTKAVANTEKLQEKNSMTFMGVDKVHGLKVKNAAGELVAVRGQGVRVGIIDTGIDYTHSMFGGAGTEAAYKAINRNEKNPGFPSKRVVGGRDFVGKSFNSSSDSFEQNIPVPDENPLDGAGHGSHVAGTVAGVGDGVQTYDGAAPEADLYALKVFGDEGGSTGDTVVIAALEFAADPNADFNNEDRLDVVNLSLGGDYGKPHSLYNQAIDNLVKGGTVTVASAGNAGDEQNIVGSPSTADSAISVAASVDYMDHNYKFAASIFTTPNDPKRVVKAIEGSTTKPIKDSDVSGKLVYVGNAAADLSAEQLQALKGNVALIDRGVVAFSDKIKRAAGAIGVVMANNVDGEPIVMGGDGKFDIPGFMIDKKTADYLKEEMKLGNVTVQFKTSELVEEPELIDTLAGFSSRGPRLLDSQIKPEISAPGLAIISAAMGKGNKAAEMQGTSMSAPHITGVVALLRQARPEVSAAEVKSLLMNTAQLITDKTKNLYPISRMGSGRVQAFLAATTPLIADASISLGEVQVEKKKTVRRSLHLRNTSDTALLYKLSLQTDAKISVEFHPSEIEVPANGEADIDLVVKMDTTESNFTEMDAFVNLEAANEVPLHVPLLAVVNKLTRIGVESLSIQSSSLNDASGAAVDLVLKNESKNPGEAEVFNLLGLDKRKPAHSDTTLSLDCDLESTGYRIVKIEGEDYLQIAAKIYNPVSNWRTCTVSVQIDSNLDQTPEQELTGIAVGDLPGLDKLKPMGLRSVLIDNKAMAKVLAQHSKDLAKNPKAELDVTGGIKAIEDIKAYEHSTVNVMQVKLSDLPKTTSGQLNLMLEVRYNDDHVVEGDDVLSDNGVWSKINLKANGSGYTNLPNTLTIDAGQSLSVPLTKGDRMNEQLLVLFPRNRALQSLTGEDSQSQIGSPTFEP